MQEVSANFLSNMFADAESAGVILEGDGVGRILRAMDECLDSPVGTCTLCTPASISLRRVTRVSDIQLAWWLFLCLLLLMGTGISGV